jgi:chromatin structure-remodeling complex subunit RSC1/2
MQQYQTPRPAPGYQQPYVQQPPAGYKAPPPVEVYILNDQANASIPQDIREQFQRDEKGRVLFFTAPPLNVSQPLTKDGRVLGHSAAYLAARARCEKAKAEKRKADVVGADAREEAAKKAKVEEDQKLKRAVQELGVKAVKALEDQLASATKTELQSLFNDQTRDGVAKVVDQLLEAQAQAITKNAEREEHVLEWEAKKRTVVTGMTARLEEKI